MASLECLHDWLANSSLPYCRFWAMHYLTGRIITSKCLIDWQDMLVTDSIHVDQTVLPFIFILYQCSDGASSPCFDCAILTH